MSEPRDARERLLAFCDEIVKGHNGDGDEDRAAGYCCCCGDTWPCEAIRAASALLAIVGHFKPESRAWSDANVQVLMSVGADALGSE